jgi:putrescine aminotransferase
MPKLHKDYVISFDLTEEEKKQLIEETVENYRNHVNPSLLKWRKSGDSKSIEWRGDGVYMYDPLGHRFIDCLGGYGVFNLGYCHPKVVEALRLQLDHEGIHSQELLNPFMARLARKLSEIAPGDLQYSFFCNSGAEAVEAALKFAQMKTDRHDFICMHGGYHGKTLGALSATFRMKYRHNFRLIDGFTPVEFGNIDAVSNAITDRTAAVILEPIQGEGGINLPSDDYLPSLRQLCDDKGVLLIFDEVQSGLGRTGRYFACEHWNVAPDIMTLAKSLGGGMVPMGATMGTPSVWEALLENPLIHSNTFGGNPLASQAALAGLEVLVEDRGAEKANAMGSYFMDELKTLKGEFPDQIAEVRGLGLMIGVEFREESRGNEVAKKLFEEHILVAHTMNNPKVIRIEPSYLITRDVIDDVMSGFRKVMS